MQMSEPMPYDERDEESGQFTPTFADAEFVDALRERDGGTTAEVAEAVGCKYRTAYARLNDLEDEGRVQSREVGNSLLWTAVDDADAEGDVEAGDGPASQQRREHAAHEAPAAGEASAAAPDHEDHEDPLADADLPGSVEPEAALTAVYAVRDYLRDHGPASMREIVTGVMPAHSLGYDVPDLEPGDRYRGAWWRRVVRPGLAALPDVEYRENHGDYRYIGDGDETT